jgi:roadblock/LC7 domain-containing protein
MSDDNKNIEYGKDGKPTSASMKWAFENDRELFLDLQEKHFTTKAKMKDNPIADFAKKIMGTKKESK